MLRPWLYALLILGLPGLATGQGAPAEAPAEEEAREAASAETPPDPRPEVQAARDAYNKGLYQKAARAFLKAVQRYSRDATLYRNLGRARTQAGDHAGAVAAYRLYLKLAPDAEDHAKVEAEMGLASRKAGDTPEVDLSTGRRTLKVARSRAAEGRFAGKDGAFGLFDSTIEAGFIGPELGDVQNVLAGEVRRLSQASLDAWWQPDQRANMERLVELKAGWAALKRQRSLSPEEAGLATAMAGLAAAGQARLEAAIDTLAPVAASDPRLRALQARILAALGRTDEARALLDALIHAGFDDPRVWLLHGALQPEGEGRAEAFGRALGL